MKFVDPAPSSSPSLDEQEDALRKGLGRARQWAVAGELSDEPLLQACLHDQRHDMEVEESRSSWLWQLIQAVQGQQRFRAAILEELTRLSDQQSVYQLCELAYFYAALGADGFRNRLYEIVEQNPVPDAAGLGEKEILKLDGEVAFLFVAGVRGHCLGSRDWDWDDDSFMYNAAEQLGEDRASNLLENANDSRVQRFCNRWSAQKKQQSERQPMPNHKERMQAIRVDNIIAEAESERPTNGWFRGWGMHASEEDLNAVLEALWSAQHDAGIVSYLRVFSNRAMPNFDARLIEFCNHADEQVRHWAFNALQMNTHPLVREFAVENIRQGLREGRFGKLLIRNYVAGDENLILDALELPADVNELHGLLMDVIKVLKHNEQADPSKLALVVYAHTPCENCRCDAARLLQARRVVPAWLPAECRFDSSEECRNLNFGNLS